MYNLSKVLKMLLDGAFAHIFFSRTLLFSVLTSSCAMSNGALGDFFRLRLAAQGA